jgi:hypothetical protein
LFISSAVRCDFLAKIGDKPMIENQVVDLMRAWLPTQGYEVVKYRHGNQQGDDIAARNRNGAFLKIECKGSQSNSMGPEFGKDTKWRNAAYAFFNQMRLSEKEPQNEVGIAFPDDSYYRALMKDLETFCKKNRVRIFWVSENSVSEW